MLDTSLKTNMESGSGDVFIVMSSTRVVVNFSRPFFVFFGLTSSYEPLPI